MWNDDSEETMLDRAIVKARDEVALYIGGALSALRKATAALDALTDNLFDVEYAEGGQRVDDIRAHLKHAAMAVRAAEALNIAHRVSFADTPGVADSES